jgi:hypothetical protein
MEMQTVLGSFRALCDMPVAWAILGAVALRALWSVAVFFTCPFVHGADRLDPETARKALNERRMRSPRFFVAMSIGLALAVGGLYALRDPGVGPLALAAIVFGVFILIVEPSRLSVDENVRRVAASRLEGAEAQAFAVDRLRASHIERVAMEIGLAALIAAVVMFY